MNISVIYLGTKGAGPVYSFEMVRELARRNYNIQCIISSYIENYNRWTKLVVDNSNVKLIVVDTYRDKKEFFLSLFKFSCFYKLIQAINGFSPSYICTNGVYVGVCDNTFYLKKDNKDKDYA